jgi:hypothetical protein
VTSDLERFNGKAMLARALTYPLAALIVPVVWQLRGRPRPALDRHPRRAAVRDRHRRQRAPHFLNWLILVSAFALALQRTSLGKLPAWSIAVGFGAATEILWELGEYAVMKLGSSGLQLTYEDTIGDLALGGVGTLLGATLVAAAFRPGVVRGSAPAS